MTRVITYGTYDLLHFGHIRLLERAKALGDYLIVGVTSDDYDRTRGKINNQQSLMERVAAVEATGLADEIVIEEYEGQKIDDILRLNVDIFTVGSDWVGKFDYLRQYCEVIYLDRTLGVSSSELRAEKRKLRIGIIGNSFLAEKYRRESKFVNGIEIVSGPLSFDNVDAVFVVSRAECHYEDTKKALLNGKHVLCDSPIATSKEKCIELQNLAKEKKLVLMDGIKTAYSTAYARMLLLVRTGKIGQIVSVDATCTSLRDFQNNGTNYKGMQNSICAWGPTALLPIFQLLGVNYKSKYIVSHYLDDKKTFDGFTKIDFIYDKAVASIKVAKAAKSEGELVVSGSNGNIWVPAPWWKTDYFEVRYENIEDNRRYFYQLDGEGLRYEIVYFSKAITNVMWKKTISDDISIGISGIIGECLNNNVLEI